MIGEGKIRFEQMENNDHDVEVGEQIVTSHISDKYLQGLLIGYVSEINERSPLTIHLSEVESAIPLTLLESSIIARTVAQVGPV